MRFPCIIITVSLFLFSCDKLSRSTFVKVSPSKSGIDFTNVLVENDTLNYTVFPYMYMGGGVAVGDINNDGLDDIFFTGNLVPNKLYLNKGDMHFEDISEKAGIQGNHQWCTGVTMADVNNDGWLDIYVCVSGKYKPSDNLLFINNKNNTFTECAKAYGINDTTSSVQATFFDYNNDGFLDLYVANYPIVLVSMGAEFYRQKILENQWENSGHLYRNNGNGTFTDVTDKAGVRHFGMSIGVVAMDFNNDGWKDLYISNDFNPPDLFYLNNGDGTFREAVRDATFQTSIFGMGLDAADINNDGLMDMYQIDMTPEDHFRRMVNVIPMSRQTFSLSLGYGMHYQYMQNSLQLNNGVFEGNPLFSNISLITGTAYTDWSWGGIFLDMDNDGNRDLFVANGVLKDINDRDILNNPNGRDYFNQMKEYRPELFPSTPVPNYAFKNNGDLTFTDKSVAWGFKEPTLSNGVSFGDFDNDGDLDIVISNVNKVSAIYENKTNRKDNHYIKIDLSGPDTNPFGLGSIVKVTSGKITQTTDLTLTRGYQSSVSPTIHFGLGQKDTIDELTVIWPDKKQQTLKKVKADQTLRLYYKNAVAGDTLKKDKKKHFEDITKQAGISFIHTEDHYDDFQYEPLLPYKNSQMGPGLAVADINGDKLDDFFAGNAKGRSGSMYVQTREGKFKELPGPWISDSIYEDAGVLLTDLDKDGKPDLLVVNGGNDPKENADFYKPRLYLNTGNGFVKNTSTLPADLNVSGKCIKAADFDHDGNIDLFIGGRIVPGNYPQPAYSYILRNNGKKGTDLRFENVTAEIAPEFAKLGLVTDALWDDFNNDGKTDLIIVGEWMNIRFFENTGAKFIEVTDKMGFGKTAGWWFCINKCDVDQDGDMDYIAGNLGLNYRYKAGDDHVFEIYSNDFDVDGKNDIVLGYTEKGILYPVNGFDATTRQIPVIKLRYNTYKDFAKATLQEIYGEDMLKASLHYQINTFASCWIENKGKGKFVMHQLPNRAQLSSINDVAEVKYGNSGKSFIIAGNLFGSEVETPRADGSIGLVLQADSKGDVTAIPPQESGLMVKGEVKAIRQIRLANGKTAYLFAINNGPLKLIESEP